MKARILQHIWFEDCGTIAEALRDRGFEIAVTRFDDGDKLPPIEAIDLLVIMGGFMSANDEDMYDWLKAEKAFIKRAIETGVKTFGICLGAQLIASALGAKTYKNAQKEIGWHKITACGDSFLPPEALAFHWHGDTFDLPEGATLAASSAVCENQAFTIDDNVIAFQFHAEVTPSGVRLLIENCRDELIDAPYIQSEIDMLNAPTENYQNVRPIVNAALSYLLD
ncbi:MAG: gamma-glutamyl-gamma-aminobutyrate hydrolase family protein [Helicobacteraceae bacterium]|jgi:GMP synthase-like glutamine amidotransferase|nr:gamma-glutamyl-gamma-aminobutyrate hydrolase family protein [Helicobacteraceae bacterium]